MFRRAYQQGSLDALTKFAGIGDTARRMLSSPNAERNINVAGLGLLTAPSLLSLAEGDDPSPAYERTKHLTDLAGLGMLVGTEFMKKHH